MLVVTCTRNEKGGWKEVGGAASEHSLLGFVIDVGYFSSVVSASSACFLLLMA